MAAAANTPSTVTALTQISKARVLASNVRQPDRTTAVNMYIVEPMTYIPVGNNDTETSKLNFTSTCV